MTLQFTQLSSSTTLYSASGGGKLIARVAGVGAGAGASGRIRYTAVGGGTLYTQDSIGEPAEPSAGNGKLNLRVFGQGFERVVGEGGGGKLGMRGMGTGAGTSYGRGRLYMRGSGNEFPTPVNYAFYLKAPPIMQGFANHGYGLLVDGVSCHDPRSRLYAALVRSVALMDEQRNQPYAGNARASDIVATSEGLGWLRSVVIEEGLLLETEVVPDSRAYGRVVSRLILEGKVANYAEAVATLKEALTLLSFEQALTLALVADEVELETQLASRYLLISRVLDQLMLDAHAEGDFQMVALVSDALLLEQIQAGTVDMVALLHDSVGVTLNLSFDDGQYIAWVLNTESVGLSRYTNYPFNSFMRIGQRYFGVHHGGVVELVGDSDMGNPISAKLRFGMFDFNDRHEKTFSDAFIGTAADGTLVLKAIFVNRDTGEKNMAIYKVNYRPAASSRETRAKLGRGVQAVDFDFVLENVDGAYFDLKSIQFNPMMGSRRTRG